MPRITVRCHDGEDIPTDTVIPTDDATALEIYRADGDIVERDVGEVKSIIAGEPAGAETEEAIPA